MDKKRFEHKQFIVMGVSWVDVVPKYVSGCYRLSEIPENARTGETGRLQLFRIDPVSVASKHPAFIVRIGHDNHEAVDVDLIGNEHERIAFARQAPGYNGHKAQALNTDPRSYRLDIKVPSVGRVFSGTVTMKGLQLGLRLEAQMSMSAEISVDVQHVRQPSED